MNENAFVHFGLLPEVCIHSPVEDQYSKMYVARNTCECASEEWLTEGQTMILGHYAGDIPLIKHVHRCAKCNEVRLADHIGANNAMDQT